MRFDFVLLADYAQTVEGKLYVQGGGLTRVTAPALPFMQSVAIAMRLLFDTQDSSEREYEFEIAVIGPDGEPIFGPHKAPLGWQRPIEQAVEGEEPGGFIALTINGVVFHAAGSHRIKLAVDGADTELPLAVIVSRT